MPAPRDSIWNSLALETILGRVDDKIVGPRSLSISAKLLFHALHARGWGGALVEQELINGYGELQFHFLRWQGKTLNMQGFSMEEVLPIMQMRCADAKWGLYRVLCAPDQGVLEAVARYTHRYEKTCCLADALLLGQSTVDPTARASVHRL